MWILTSKIGWNFHIKKKNLDSNSKTKNSELKMLVKIPCSKLDQKLKLKWAVKYKSQSAKKCLKLKT
jgi:hypothetical protein